jgi:hypothetical protein
MTRAAAAASGMSLGNKPAATTATSVFDWPGDDFDDDLSSTSAPSKPSPVAKKEPAAAAAQPPPIVEVKVEQTPPLAPALALAPAPSQAPVPVPSTVEPEPVATTPPAPEPKIRSKKEIAKAAAMMAAAAEEKEKSEAAAATEAAAAATEAAAAAKAAAEAAAAAAAAAVATLAEPQQTPPETKQRKTSGGVVAIKEDTTEQNIKAILDMAKREQELQKAKEQLAADQHASLIDPTTGLLAGELPPPQQQQQHRPPPLISTPPAPSTKTSPMLPPGIIIPGSASGTSPSGALRSLPLPLPPAVVLPTRPIPPIEIRKQPPSGVTRMEVSNGVAHLPLQQQQPPKQQPQKIAVPSSSPRTSIILPTQPVPMPPTAAAAVAASATSNSAETLSMLPSQPLPLTADIMRSMNQQQQLPPTATARLPQHPLPPTTSAPPTAAAPTSSLPPDHLTLIRLQQEALAAKDLGTYYYLQYIINGHPEHVALTMSQLRATAEQQQATGRPQPPQDGPYNGPRAGATPPQYGPPGQDSYYQQPPAAHLPPPQTQQPLPQDPYVLELAKQQQQPPSLEFTLPNLETYPVVWQGFLGLKMEVATVQFHYVSGCKDLARASLPVHHPQTDLSAMPTLRIGQRMRLEESQLEGVYRKMDRADEHCVLLALPCGKDAGDVEDQSRRLRSHFITYLQLKSAAGIVNVPGADDRNSFVVHVFPSCDFANATMGEIAPDLLSRVAEIEHMVIIIATTS